MATKQTLYAATKNPALLKQLAQQAKHIIVKGEDGSFTCITHSCAALECLPPTTNNVVWQASLDNNAYQCTCVRMEPYQGMLTITRGPAVVFNKQVFLSYNAEFGAHSEDEHEWRALCLEVVDADYKKRGIKPPK